MRPTVALAAIALALTLTTQVHAAQEVPADLQAAIRLRAQAVAGKDAAVWDRLTTADFTTVLEDGRLQTKAERLTQLKGEKPEALPPPPLAERFSTHGNTVIQRTQGQDRSWIVTVWVKDGQDWRVAAVQITPAAKQ
jgi:hypothetical protein